MKVILKIVSRSQCRYGRWLKPVQKYTDYVVITWCFLGLPKTDDTLKVKESRVFLRIQIKEWSKNGKTILFEIVFIFEIEYPSGSGLLSLIKNNLALCWTFVNVFCTCSQWVHGFWNLFSVLDGSKNGIFQ